MLKTASVFRRGGDIFVHSAARDVHGIHRASEPFFRLSVHDPPVGIGQSVLVALEAFRRGVPGETYVRGAKRPPSPFLIVAAARSWKEFEKGSRLFVISHTDGEIRITITPTIPAPKGGYLHQPDRDVSVPLDAEVIGRALLEQM
jgi:hypothetical protein